MQCELCGFETENLSNIEIEGTIMSVCNSCNSLGSKRANVVRKKERKFVEKEILDVVSANYSSKIRNARESRNLKQEDFAKLLGIKQSELQGFETGKLTPNLDQARHFEKKLNIKLIEQESAEFNNEKKETSGLTLGDLIKFKK